MQRLVALCACIVTAALCWTAQAVAVPLTLSHQGRLLDGSSNPVTGVHTVTVRMYDAAAGGSPLWTEVHPGVQVTDGLFELSLGSLVAIGPDLLSPPSGSGLPPAERFLEMQVDGDSPLTPRLRLHSAPYSVAAARLSGDVESAPGELRAGTRLIVSNIGSSGEDGVRLSVDPGGDSHLSVANLGSSGLDGVRLDVDAAGKSGLTVSNIGSSGEDGVSVVADGSSRKLVVSNIGSMGLDGVEVRVDGTGRSLAVGNIGSSGEDGVRLHVDALGASSLAVSPIGSMGLDGVRFHADALSSSVAIKTKGTGADKDRAGGSTSDTGAVLYVEHDDDNDGVAENSVRVKTGLLSSSMAINQKGTGADANRAGGVCDDTSAIIYVDHDDDGDGIAENSVSTSSSATNARLAIKTKGTGAHRLGAGGDCDDTDALLYVDSDDDGDGIPEREASLSVTPTTSSVAIKTKGTGADKDRSAINAETSDTTSSIRSGMDLDDDGLSDVVVLEACAIDSAHSEISFSYPSAAAPASVSGTKTTAKQKKWLCSNFRLSSTSETVVDVSCDSATAGSVWSADDLSGLAATTLAIRASVDPLVNPIEHSSGAMLTPGGVWTNASDEHLKENFAAVDGDDLLRKIDQLPIQQWNYKNESDDVKHIGPTAQDFQATFGVGANDRTISTIDPSGIALAAVKELYRQNQELQTSNQELRDQLEQLRKMVMDLKTQ